MFFSLAFYLILLLIVFVCLGGLLGFGFSVAGLLLGLIGVYSKFFRDLRKRV
ncbi:hypothetical protein [Helicobacter pylori]|uniref:hypothetical protein n=1 Tax=Helicobacter pylori TaxID=210 RepID=UPI00191C32ED|nr:hypothetical protein [Helicobacter pylori]